MQDTWPLSVTVHYTVNVKIKWLNLMLKLNDLDALISYVSVIICTKW